jgi:hypothetical protein
VQGRGEEGVQALTFDFIPKEQTRVPRDSEEPVRGSVPRGWRELVRRDAVSRVPRPAEAGPRPVETTGYSKRSTLLTSS